jgi:tetratricopeptide (TPR) repeat protein
MIRSGICWVCLAALFAAPTLAEEELDVAGVYQAIVADYQRVVGATENAAGHAAAGRLARVGYRGLISRAIGIDELSADDLHALGQCHEAIGETETAKELYAKSLAADAAARTHLSLARVNLRDDLTKADEHLASAVELQPEHPDLNRFRLSLAAAHQRERDWAGSVPFLEHLLGYTKTLSERAPASSRLKIGHDAVQKQLDRARRFDGMTGNAAPALKVEHWAQGEATALDGLKGKVVLVDFCAMWAKPSRDRIELLKELQGEFGDKGLAIVGVTLAYKHKYDAETDKVTVEEKLSAEDECAGIAEFAKKHEIPWRLGVIGQETVDQYGVATLPHTVVLDNEGNVAAILLGGEKNAGDLETIVTTALGIQTKDE